VEHHGGVDGAVDVVGDAKLAERGIEERAQEEKFDSVKSSVMGTWVRMFTCCREAAENGCGGAETKGFERWAEEPLEDRSGLVAIGGCGSSGLQERED
jgi:hypothetical protein